MFSLACTLFYSGSAEDCSSLFVWFIGSMVRADSSGACAPAMWRCTFADRLVPLRVEAPQSSPGSRACCFSACAGLRLRRTDGSLAIIASHRAAFLPQERVGILVLRFSMLNTRRTLMGALSEARFQEKSVHEHGAPARLR